MKHVSHFMVTSGGKLPKEDFFDIFLEKIIYLIHARNPGQETIRNIHAVHVVVEFRNSIRANVSSVTVAGNTLYTDDPVTYHMNTSECPVRPNFRLFSFTLLCLCHPQ